MRNLADIVESLFTDSNIITESFQSSKLRELVDTIDKSKYKTEQYLPKGVAWDKITDEEIIYGESNDAGFAKKYVKNTDYIILWFPLTSTVVASRTYGGRHGGTHEYTVMPGNLYITSGNDFIKYDTSKRNWKTYQQAALDLVSFTSLERKKYPEQKELETDYTYHRRIGVTRPEDYVVQNSSSYKPSVRDWKGPLDGHLTVKRLEENAICSCLAIGKETLAKYSTTFLIQKRWESKLNAIALMQKPLNDYVVKTIRGQQTSSWEDSNKFTTGMVDYPAIRELNKNHYKELLRGSAGIKFIRKYVDKCKTIVDAIDKYTQILNTKQKNTPEAIKKLVGDQFIDIIFNSKSNTNYARITELLTKLQCAYNSAIDYLNNAIDYVNRGGDPDEHWGAKYIDQYIDQAMDYIDELNKLG